MMREEMIIGFVNWGAGTTEGQKSHLFGGCCLIFGLQVETVDSYTIGFHFGDD